MMLWQTFQNVAMTLKIMPVTGLPLPFISYGGSGLHHVLRDVRPRAERLHAPHALSSGGDRRRAGSPGAGPSFRPADAAPTGGVLRRAVECRQKDGRRMTSIWPELEPLLARVQKPARYIGLEDGMAAPQHADPDDPHAPAEKVAWLLRVSGHLRDRPAEPRSADPLRDRQRARRRCRRAGLRPVGRPRSRTARRRSSRCSASTRIAPPASSTCWRSTSRRSSCTPTCST